MKSRPTQAFEALEPRQLLSAPTATLSSNDLTADSVFQWKVDVRYQSDVPIDLASLGVGDVVGSSSNGYWQPAGVTDQSGYSSGFYASYNGDRTVIATYYIQPPNRNFNIAVSGTYALHVPAGQVRNINGEAIAATVLFQANEQFTAPHYGIFGQTVDATGVSIQASALNFPNFFQLHVVGPNGYDVTTNATPGSTHLVANGGSWDYSDSGNYHVAARSMLHYTYSSGSIDEVMSPWFDLGDFQLSFTTPRVQLVSTSVGAANWAFTLKYSTAPGQPQVNPASLGGSDLNVTIKGGADTLAATLTQPPTVNSDGSVTATYSVNSPRAAGWSMLENGQAAVQLRAAEVQTTDGAAVQGSTLASYYLWFAPPHFQSVTTSSVSRSAVDFVVTYKDPGALINTASLDTQDLLVQVTGGPLYTPSRVSFARQGDTLQVTYHVAAAPFTALANGGYTVSLRDQQVSLTSGGFVASSFVGSWWLWFS